MSIDKLTRSLPTSWDDIPVVIDLEYVSAYILKYTADRLKRLSQAGKFPAFKVEKCWRVDKQDLRNWIEEKRQNNAKQPSQES